MALVGALSLSYLVPGAALAGSRTAVDPAGMQPGLNPTFAPWECWRNGPSIVCDGERRWTWSQEPTFLECDGRTVYTTGTDTRTLRRVGDADGLALWARQHVAIEERLTLNADGSGPAIRAFGAFEQWYDYPVAGDLSTRTERYTGVDIHVTAPGLGVIFHDTGIKTFDVDGNVLLAHGPHPLLADFDGTFQRICDAFERLGA